jgi:hypothetical protein
MTMFMVSVGLGTLIVIIALGCLAHANNLSNKYYATDIDRVLGLLQIPVERRAEQIKIIEAVHAQHVAEIRRWHKYCKYLTYVEVPVIVWVYWSVFQIMK